MSMDNSEAGGDPAERRQPLDPFLGRGLDLILQNRNGACYDPGTVSMLCSSRLAAAGLYYAVSRGGSGDGIFSSMVPDTPVGRQMP
jgi:hypothetical protein